MRWLRFVVKGVVMVTVALLCLQLLFLLRNGKYFRSKPKYISETTSAAADSGQCRSSLDDRARQFGPLTDHNAERLRRIEATCRLARHGHVDRMTSHPDTRTAYCVVPKTSCTFWLSLLHHVLGKDDDRDNNNGGGVKFHGHGDDHHHPLHVPRGDLHNKLLKKIMKFQSMRPGERLSDDLADHFRFLFVRDPYSRLWSSYVDKLFLLDFWWTEGRKVKAFYESQSPVGGTESAEEKPGESSSSSSSSSNSGSRKFSRCCSDISFAEFVSYVVRTGEKNPQSLNEHWRPVEHLCNPCQFCPHLVGRVETFRQDSLPVLRRLNLTWVLRDYHHGLHQMDMLLQENFRQLHNREVKVDTGKAPAPFYPTCTDGGDVARRLWMAFQMYGYIPESVPFPERELGSGSNVTAARFKDVLFQTYRDVSDEVKGTLSRQRQRAMEDAYRSVPMDVMEKLSSLYMYEFLAFDYDMRPYALFEKRYQLST